MPITMLAGALQPYLSTGDVRGGVEGGVVGTALGDLFGR